MLANLAGSALFIQLCCTGCGASPGGRETNVRGSFLITPFSNSSLDLQPLFLLIENLL